MDYPLSLFELLMLIIYHHVFENKSPFSRPLLTLAKTPGLCYTDLTRKAANNVSLGSRFQ